MAISKLPLCVQLLILVAGVRPVMASVDSTEADKILIQNVRLIDREGQTDDRSVNILIIEGELRCSST